MCGRFVLITTLNVIQKNFDVQENLGSFNPSWNITPGQSIPVIVRHKSKNSLILLQWGLIPYWAKDQSIGNRMFNARAETIDQKPSFRSAFKKRRCLIIADGFYEWKAEGKQKIPLYFYLKSGKSFGFAGLYEIWISPDGKQINTCTVITTAPNELIQPIHDRMPVIVPKDMEQIWIDNEKHDKAALFSILKPYPAEEMNHQTGMGSILGQKR
jgi:putative SOS response-associated peptidase YedK